MDQMSKHDRDRFMRYFKSDYITNRHILFGMELDLNFLQQIRREIDNARTTQLMTDLTGISDDIDEYDIDEYLAIKRNESLSLKEEQEKFKLNNCYLDNMCFVPFNKYRKICHMHAKLKNEDRGIRLLFNG